MAISVTIVKIYNTIQWQNGMGTGTMIEKERPKERKKAKPNENEHKTVFVAFDDHPTIYGSLQR